MLRPQVVAWSQRSIKTWCRSLSQTRRFCLASSRLPTLNLHGSNRSISVTAVNRDGKGTVPVVFFDANSGKNGTTVNAKMGATLLEVARENDIELEGACEGTLACSTCHCVFEKEVFDKLPPIADEEMDMLDLAASLTETSRLGCQIKVTEDLRGAKIRIPDEINNLYGSGSDRSA